MNSPYVQYGCGLSAPHEWLNFDASPILRLQKLPLLGQLVGGPKFPPTCITAISSRVFR